MLSTFMVALLAFVAGGATVLAALWLIEKRTFARPGARVAVATRLLDESAAANDAWRAWCAAQPQSAVTDDSQLDIHQWGVR